MSKKKKAEKIKHVHNQDSATYNNERPTVIQLTNNNNKNTKASQHNKIKQTLTKKVGPKIQITNWSARRTSKKNNHVPRI